MSDRDERYDSDEPGPRRDSDERTLADAGLTGGSDTALPPREDRVDDEDDPDNTDG